MKISRRPDSLEAEQMRHTFEIDPGFRLYCARIERMRETAAAALVTAETWDKTQRLQEDVQLLDRVLALPKILMSEK